MSSGDSGCERGPTPVLPPKPAKQGSLCSDRLWAEGRGSKRQSFSPSWERKDGG